MKTHPLLLMVLAALPAAQLHAAAYLSDFSGLPVDGVLEGVDGWQQNGANDSDGTYIYPLAFGSLIGTDPAAAVGGFYVTEPPNPAGEFHIFHTLTLPAAQQFTFSMNFALIDSSGFDENGIGYGEPGFNASGTIYGQERNSFRIGLHNAADGEYFSLIFDPVAGDPDPTVSPDDAWNVSWSTGGVKTTVMAVFESQLYGLTMNVVPNGDDVNFSFSLAGTNTATTGGTLIGMSDEEITQLQIGISPTYSSVTASPQLGTNLIIFNGVAAIPEPSSLALACCGLMTLLVRRRRRC
jgi:hypothetical protein